jgi:hypothetical protein
MIFLAPMSWGAWGGIGSDGAKVAFAAAWIGAQIALITTSGSRPDGAFGFRMFSESSTIEVRLFRQLDEGKRVEVPDGEWVAKDATGAAHRISWQSRVKEPNLTVFGVTMHASYGAGAQVQRWSAAVADVARHIPDDAETRALELQMTVRKNGRPPAVTRIVARR